MADKQSASFLLLKQQYFALDANFNDLFALCATDKERDQLRHDYVTARDNFWAARDRGLDENDPRVVKARKELQGEQASIENDLKKAKMNAQVLKTITAAVQLASSLVMLAAAF